MKSLRLLAVTLLACACSFAVAHACDTHQKSSKSTAAAVSSKKTAGTTAATSGCSAKAAAHQKAAADHGACTADMAAQCTPEMHAACMSNASVAAAMGCPAMGNATTAVAASAKGHAAEGAGCCAAAGTAATAAAAHGQAKSAGMDHCASGAAVAAAGFKCSAHANSVAHDCSACEDWMGCEQEVMALGAKTQVVPLKNGAMIVYTADSPADVKTLQHVIAKRHEKMVAALTGANDQKLCDECKSLRGAMASGKLHREVVNVERGCMTLLTSNDKTIVTKIREMTGQPVAMR
jgi:hypothetical protein